MFAQTYFESFGTLFARTCSEVLLKLALGVPAKDLLLWGVAQKGGGVEGQSPRRAPQSAKAPIRVLFAKLFPRLLSQEKASVGSYLIKELGNNFKI